MTDEKKWFLARGGQISGPHSRVTIEAELQTQKRHEKILFWARGLSQWLDSTDWQAALVQAAHKQTSRETKQWSVELEGHVQLLTMDEVYMFIERNFDDIWKIRFKPENVNQWLDISQLPSLMNRFQVTRASERAGLLGSVTIEFAGKSIKARARDVSASGIGVAGLGPIPVGEIAPVILDSPNLPSVIHAHAQIVYRHADGQAGLKFVGLTAENTSLIVEYLKRFIEIRETPRTDRSSGLERNI